MGRRIIIGIVAFFVIMAGITFWIFNSVDSTNAENQARTEADFTTQKFVITELWEMQKKKGGTVLSSYLFMKVKNEKINLRLPFQGEIGDNAISKQLNEGDTIEVTVLKKQLEAARHDGMGAPVKRFIMGDKREVSIYKLSLHGDLLVNKDIHDWDQAQVTLLGRMADNPYVLIILAIILFAIIGFIKRKAEARKRSL